MEKIKIKQLLILNGIILILILLALLFRKPPKIDDFDTLMVESTSIEYGKSIGRMAVLKYLNETKQLGDSVTIDIIKLMEIEDKIDTTLKKSDYETIHSRNW
jgi:hypothetical protein